MLLFLGTAAGGLISARHIPLFAVVAPLILSRHLLLILDGTANQPEEPPRESAYAEALGVLPPLVRLCAVPEPLCEVLGYGLTGDAIRLDPRDADLMGSFFDLYFAMTSRAGLWTYDEMADWQRAAGLVPRRRHDAVAALHRRKPSALDVLPAGREPLT